MPAGKRDTTAWAWLVGDPTVFAEEHWAKRPLHRTTDGSRVPLDLAALDDWIAHGARRPNLRVVQAGRTLDERTYTSAVRMGGVWVDGVADPAKVAGLIAGGATLVGQNLEVVLPRLRRFVADVQGEISHPVQANAYLTPPDAAGLGRHADTHDVVVLQVEGHKTWDVDGLGEVRMAPGDVLYVPRGTLHAAWTNDVGSLHVTLGILCLTAAQVVRSLLDRVEGGDTRLPLGFARAETTTWQAAVVSVVEHLGKDVLALDGAALVGAPTTAPATGPGWLAPLMRASPLGGSDPLRRAVACTWRAEGDRAVLTTADRLVSFPALAGAALRAVCEGDQVSAESLPGLDPASQLVVTRRLLREGILIRAAAAAAAP